MPKIEPVKFQWTRKRVIIASLIVLVAVLGAGVLIVTHKKPAAPVVKALVPTSNDPAALKTYYDQRISSSVKAADQAEPYFEKARLEMTQSDYKAALSDALMANSLQPNSAIIIDTLGTIYAKLGDTPNALIYYQQALALYQAQPDSELMQNYYRTQINALKAHR